MVRKTAVVRRRRNVRKTRRTRGGMTPEESRNKFNKTIAPILVKMVEDADENLDVIGDVYSDIYVKSGVGSLLETLEKTRTRLNEDGDETGNEDLYDQAFAYEVAIKKIKALK